MFVKSTILAVSTSALLARGAPFGSGSQNGYGMEGGNQRRGYTGPTGPTGFTGPTGPTGFTGPTSYTNSGTGSSNQSPQFTVPSFAATCWASDSPTCEVFVPTSQGFISFQSGSNSISDYAPAGSSIGSSGDGVNPYAPMAAVNTNDVGGSEVSLFFMSQQSNSNYGSAPTLSYYSQNSGGSWSNVQQAPTSSGGSLRRSQSSAPAEYMTTASWSCDGNPCYGVWWSDNSGAVYQLLNINDQFSYTGALSSVQVSGDYRFAVSVSENSQSATTIEIYGNGGQLWTSSPSSTSNLASAYFTQSTFASASLSGMTGVNIWTGDGRLYSIDSASGGLGENSFNGGTSWVPASTEAGGVNPWDIIPAVGGAVTNVAQAYWADGSDFIQVFSIVSDSNDQYEIDAIAWLSSGGWGTKQVVGTVTA